ncbi:LysR family transcriptional regulator [Granulicella sp. 5B5]|uniref:LysR substrate-binding domain-containing protein n=1 Tax=Granulicella sp. 5B5 TaxID=1617967 RepID=UPI0015F45DCD|nr:LysR substrate-binding domain-containing protein [Granulicella sp. 5B5]QMV19623.1 LysR family transcriptional regulator [Granulicella sp. 5B5]
MDRDIELRHLRYFIAVAEELHFGRAAIRLHLAQPPLSQQIRRLEELLGYPLFIRTSRSVRLTQAGEVYLERARRLLLSAQRDLDEARAIAKGEVGSLHLGFVGSAVLTSLPAILRAYRERFPNVELHLNESFSSRVLEGLQSGNLDVGILRDADTADAIHVEPLFSEAFVAVVPAHHPLASRRSITPAALRDEPFIFYPRSAGSRAYEKPLSLCEAHGFRPRIVQEATHWLTILRLVGAGIGVSIAPVCVTQIDSAESVCIPFRGVDVRSQVELAWRADSNRSMIHRFAEVARSVQSTSKQSKSASHK